MEKKIELVHFQLTKNCNLRCWFCGQWGKKGFFSDSLGEPLSLQDWMKVIDELCVYRKETGVSPDIILWGGEPLVCSFFDDIVKILVEKGFNLGIVTNGTMIDRHVDVLREFFKQIYVSIDGPRDIHDSIRGKGVFEKVKANLELLKGAKAKITIMSVMSADNIDILDSMCEELLKLNCDEIYLQEMIGLTEAEAGQYKAAMEEIGVKAEYIDSWIIPELPSYDKAIIQSICEKYKGRVIYKPHGAGKSCQSANSHIHIAWNGNVLYCTDFYDFSAGNVKEEKLLDIFRNERSEAFRKMILENKCTTCNHCSWRQSETFKL